MVSERVQSRLKVNEDKFTNQLRHNLEISYKIYSPYFTESKSTLYSIINPLNAELNPICHLLALLGAHHILHVSRTRVKARLLSLMHTLRSLPCDR